jgi:hypothetical protein
MYSLESIHSGSRQGCRACIASVSLDSHGLDFVSVASCFGIGCWTGWYKAKISLPRLVQQMIKRGIGLPPLRDDDDHQKVDLNKFFFFSQLFDNS